MKLTLESIQQINLFERVTGAKVKDSFVDDNVLTFIVEEGNVQKALKGLDRAKQVFKKELKIIAFACDPVKFIKNLLFPLKVKEIKQENKIVIISCQDSRIKGKVFGREKQNLKRMLELVQKYFDIEEIKVE